MEKFLNNKFLQINVARSDDDNDDGNDSNGEKKHDFCRQNCIENEKKKNSSIDWSYFKIVVGDIRQF